jgi:hypothetical protein
MFDVLFYAHDLGINYPIYLLMLLAGTYWALSFHENVNRTVFLALSAVMMALSLQYMLFTNEVFEALNFLLIPILYFLTVLFSLGEYENTVVQFLSSVFVPVAHMDKFIRCGTGLMRTTGVAGKKQWGKILLGVLFAAIALVFILPLMISGDAAFSVLFHKLFQWDISFDFVAKIILFLLVAFYSFGYIYWLYHPKKQQEDVKFYEPGITPMPKAQRDYNGFVHTLLTFLIVIGIVFLIFAFVQILYLFLGVTAGLPSDFSYADYARSGFFQVWILTVINVAIILAGEKLAAKITAFAGKVFKIIFTVYAALNFCMTAAAFYKMLLYDQAYGFTRLRLLVFVYLVYQVIMILALLYKIWVREFRFMRMAFILGLACYLALNFVNIDSIIVTRNIARYEKTGQIDMDYLINDLSYDSLLKVEDFADNELDYETYVESTQDYANADDAQEAIAQEISERKYAALQADRGSDWQSWNAMIHKVAESYTVR